MSEALLTKCVQLVMLMAVALDPDTRPGNHISSR